MSAVLLGAALCLSGWALAESEDPPADVADDDVAVDDVADDDVADDAPQAVAPLQQAPTPLYYGTADLQGSGMAPTLVERRYLDKLMRRTTDPQPNRSVVVAANGGGLRAANYTTAIMLGLSALQAEEGASMLDTVDGWSSVSGGNFPILQYMAWLHSLEPGGDRSGPYVDAAGHLDVEALDAHLRTMRANMDMDALKRWRPQGMARMLDRHLGVDHELSLKHLEEDDDIPGWIPNSVMAPSGQLLPITTHTVWLRRDRSGTGQCRRRAGPATHLPANLAAMASSAVPGAVPPVAACVGSAKVGDHRGQATEAWLLDGAWSDRMGLATAFDLVTTLPEQHQRVVIAVDSRPQPQVNRSLPAGMRWDSFAAALGHGIVHKLKRRVQLIGTGLELMRYRADHLLMGHYFGHGPEGPVDDIQRDALQDERYSRCLHFQTGHGESGACEPERFGLERVNQAARWAGEPLQEVHTLRLGTDLLLQPELWNLDERGFTVRRQNSCQRIAARLFTVLALQPTDLSLGGAFLVDEEDITTRDGSKLMYPYGMEPWETPERQAAILSAGLLTVFLHADTLHKHLAAKDEPYSERKVSERFVRAIDPAMSEVIGVNFRDSTNARDWWQCTGLGFPTDAEHERDKVNDNCEDRSVESAERDTSHVDRSLPQCAAHKDPKRDSRKVKR